MVASALKWIDGLLREHHIPYLICGGCAAFAYGSKRSINDIDIFVPDDHFELVATLGEQYITKPAKYYCEDTEGWRVNYFQLLYDGIKIEIASDKNVQIFDAALQQWVTLEVEVKTAMDGLLFDLAVPLIPREALVKYKTALSRPVDLEDIKAITENTF